MLLSESTSTAALWTPFALFVVTALSSQLLQRIMDRDDDDKEDISDDYNMLEENRIQNLRELYSTRRMSDRLSFDSTHAPRDLRIKDGSNLRTIHTSNVSTSSRRRRNSPDTEKDDDEPESFYDFHPRNRNWAHFELARWNQPPKDEEDGEDLGSDETDLHKEAFSDSSSTSSSIEESFLWTDARTSRRHPTFRRSTVEVVEEPVAADEPGQPMRLKTVVRRVLESIASFDTDGSNGRIRERECRCRLPTSEEEEALHHCAGERENGGRQMLPPSVRSLLPQGAVEDGGSRWSLRRYSSNPELDRFVPPDGHDLDMEIQMHNRNHRTMYNARIMPNKVVMIRHGQSMGNVNESLFSTTPDNAMPLTKLGWDQARKAGQVLKDEVIGRGESVHFIVSPYVRTVETFHGLVSAWCDPAEFKHIKNREERLKAWYGRLLELGLTWHEDPRIREQDFGNYQDPEAIKKSKKERHRFGVFFYRFPHGESASDVFDRVSTFLDSLWRSFDLNRSRNYVLVTHGISIRVLLARYFRYSIDQFNVLSNPKNCEMIILAHDRAGKLQLEGRCEIENEEVEDGETQVVGASFHRRLRVLPQEWVQKVRIRISYDD